MTLKIGTNIHLLNDFKPDDYYLWTYCIFFVNKQKIKDVGELRQWTVEEWEQLGQHVIDNGISDSGAGAACKAVSTQMVDSLNILCD